jgi:hypothetical protein
MRTPKDEYTAKILSMTTVNAAGAACATIFLSQNMRTGMANQQDWRTESYKGMDVHVTALPHDGASAKWDYTVRISQPGEDSSSESELAAESGDDADYASKEEAVQAGFAKGYAMVDALLK